MLGELGSVVYGGVEVKKGEMSKHGLKGHVMGGISKVRDYGTNTNWARNRTYERRGIRSK